MTDCFRACVTYYKLRLFSGCAKKEEEINTEQHFSKFVKDNTVMLGKKTPLSRRRKQLEITRETNTLLCASSCWEVLKENCPVLRVRVVRNRKTYVSQTISFSLSEAHYWIQSLFIHLTDKFTVSEPKTSPWNGIFDFHNLHIVALSGI